MVKGKWVRLSAARRILVDVVFFGRDTIKVTISRQMDLRPVIDARARSSLSISWVTIFARAFGLVALEHPKIRRAYVKLPWPGLYQYEGTVVSIPIERDHRGENALLFGLLPHPETRSLRNLDAQLKWLKTAPLETIREFRWLLRVAGLPLPIRRPIWWLCLNHGWLRARSFGTFSISIVAGLGATIEYPAHPIGFYLTYGPFSEDGQAIVRLSFDHRLIDGADIARALARLEAVLNTQVVEELAGAV